jgi:MFS family permease
MALSNLALFGGAFFTPVVVGKITHTIGWEWSFYLIAIFSGVLLPFMFFFVPETAFRRENYLNTSFAGDATPLRDASDKHTGRPISHSGSGDHREEMVDHPNQNSYSSYTSHPTATFQQSLLPFNGRKTDENIFKLIIRPLPLFFHPAVFWACLIQGTLIGWTVMIGVVLAAILVGPPLWFDEVKTGYMYTGPFIGAILGFVLSGLLSDWSTKFMIRRNKGVYEPEFRILLVIPQLIFGCVGLYGFGVTANHPTHWIWPDFFFALEVIGMVLGAVASALYIVDAHRESHQLRLARKISTH